MFRFNINLWSRNKLELTFSRWPLAASVYFKYPKLKVDSLGISSSGRTFSFCFMKPDWKMPRLKRSDNSWLPFTCIVQDQLMNFGIAVHNSFRNECTCDFSCCSWSSTDEYRAILGSLVGASRDMENNEEIQQRSEAIYVCGYNPGECKCCGKLTDTRLGCCLECADNVTQEELTAGVVLCRDKLTGKSWVA